MIFVLRDGFFSWGNVCRIMFVMLQSTVTVYNNLVFIPIGQTKSSCGLVEKYYNYIDSSN